MIQFDSHKKSIRIKSLKFIGGADDMKRSIGRQLKFMERKMKAIYFFVLTMGMVFASAGKKTTDTGTRLGKVSSVNYSKCADILNPQLDGVKILTSGDKRFWIPSKADYKITKSKYDKSYLLELSTSNNKNKEIIFSVDRTGDISSARIIYNNYSNMLGNSLYVHPYNELVWEVDKRNEQCVLKYHYRMRFRPQKKRSFLSYFGFDSSEKEKETEFDRRKPVFHFDLCKDIENFFKENPHLKECSRRNSKVNRMISGIFKRYSDDIPNANSYFGISDASVSRLSDIENFYLRYYSPTLSALKAYEGCIDNGMASFLDDKSIPSGAEVKQVTSSSKKQSAQEILR